MLEPQVGGRLYEVTDDGEQDWGRVLEWDPPHRFLLDWQIGEARGTEVEVRFSPEGPGARVELEHRGFSSGDPRERYSGGWDVVLAPFVESAQALDADVDRLPGRAVAQQRGHQLGEPPRREELRRTPPAPPASTSCIPVTYSAASCSGVKRGTGSKRCVRTSTYRSTCPSQLPSRNGMTCSRVQIHGPSSTSSSPASSASSRTIACSCVSPGSSPPPGVAHNAALGNSKLTSRIRSAGSRMTARAACRSLTATRGTPGTSAAARSQGTAAFAGEVDGSTQSAVSPRRRSCAPSSARSPNAPR